MGRVAGKSMKMRDGPAMRSSWKGTSVSSAIVTRITSGKRERWMLVSDAILDVLAGAGSGLGLGVFETGRGLPALAASF